jgi:hypothetical protein
MEKFYPIYSELVLNYFPFSTSRQRRLHCHNPKPHDNSFVSYFEKTNYMPKVFENHSNLICRLTKVEVFKSKLR